MSQRDDPDYWFKRTKRYTALTGILFVLLIITVSIVGTSSENSSVSSAALAAFLILDVGFIVSAVATAYAISADKRMREKSGYDTKTRHTLTILVFCYFSALMYIVYYLLARNDTTGTGTNVERGEATETVDSAQTNSTVERRESGVTPSSDNSGSSDRSVGGEASVDPDASVGSSAGDQRDHTTVYCTECGHELINAAQFCTECGNELPETR